MFNNLLVEKYRPQILSEIVLSAEVRDWAENIVKSGEIPHVLLCGPAGLGKTSLAKILVKELDLMYRYINASDERGIDSIREKVVPFAQTKSLDGKIKVIILDEADGLTSDSQRALRNIMEEYSANIRFVLTANYKNRICKPLLSRVQSFDMLPPLRSCIKRVVHVIKSENIQVPPDQKEKLRDLLTSCYPDLRKMINIVQKNTKNGILHIQNEALDNSIVSTVLKMIDNKEHTDDIRKYVIDNETEFNNDYHVFLKCLFEAVYNSEIKIDTKKKALLIIGSALYKHQFVLDFEINAYCCLLELVSVL